MSEITEERYVEIDGEMVLVDSSVPDNLLMSYLANKNAPDGSPAPKEEDLPWYEDAYEWTKKNLDIPAGLAGAAAGAKYGAAGGPKGIVLGGIIGGAGGTFGGAFASDLYEASAEATDPDYGKAFTDAIVAAGESVLIDLATLGIGKWGKAYLRSRKELGLSPEKAAQDIISKAQEGTKVGSSESLQASQRMLQEGGATLTPSMTGKSNAFLDFSESIADLGVLSQSQMAANATRINEIIVENLNKIVQKTATGPLDSADLGMELNTIVSAGRNAMIEQYGLALNEITPLVKKATTPTRPFINRLKGFRGRYTSEKLTRLTKKTESFVNDLESVLSSPTINGRTLLDLDKKITQEISTISESLGRGESGVSTADLRQLQDLSKTLHEGVQTALSGISPKVANEYKALKKQYAENMDGLLPTINSNVLSGIASGKRGFEVLGRMLLTSKSPEKIEAFMRSIDTAYAAIGKEEALGLTFKTAQEAKQAIRASFLEKTFSLSATELPNFGGFRNLAIQWGSKDGARALKAVFGEDTPRVQQIANLIAESSSNPQSNFFGLSLRGKEVGILTGASAQLVGTAALAQATSDFVVSSGTVLLTPVVLAKIATSPRLVNKLIAFEKKKFSSSDARDAAAAIILNDALKTLSFEEKEEVNAKVRVAENQQ